MNERRVGLASESVAGLSEVMKKLDKEGRESDRRKKKERKVLHSLRSARAMSCADGTRR